VLFTLRERFGSGVIQRARIENNKEELLVSCTLIQDRPLPDAYWVIPGRFLAGPYPGALDESETREKLRRLLRAGITCFIDLTIEGESSLFPYARILTKEATQLGLAARTLRRPIPDMSTPSRAEMAQILENIASALQAGENIYLHCWGGRGRTGTVVGCYLVQQGLNADEALEQIHRWRAGTPRGGLPSPETTGQIYFVMNWVGE
jgi:protein-tyrosine phosphatase